MKFLVDAQLSARLARFLSSVGHDALHTSELPDGNRTTDVRIAELADDEGRVVATKDRDFREGHLLARSPRRLLSGRDRQHHQHCAAVSVRGTSRRDRRCARRGRFRRVRSGFPGRTPAPRGRLCSLISGHGLASIGARCPVCWRQSFVAERGDSYGNGVEVGVCLVFSCERTEVIADDEPINIEWELRWKDQ